MREWIDLLKFLLGMCIYLVGFMFVVVWDILVERLQIPNSFRFLMKLIAERSSMNFRQFSTGFAVSLMVLVLLGMLFVSLGNPIPNIFDPNNTLFFLIVGLIAGSIGGIIVTVPELIRELL